VAALGGSGCQPGKEKSHGGLRRRIDSELVEAWEYASECSPDLQRALGNFFDNWQSILEGNQCLDPERWVDHSDLKRIPGEFHILLKPRCPSTFLTPPLQAAKHPNLHRRYPKWQATTAAPHIAAFARYMEDAERKLIQAQPLFAWAFWPRKGAPALHPAELDRLRSHAPPVYSAARLAPGGVPVPIQRVARGVPLPG
jgi:hypothetical protein